MMISLKMLLAMTVLTGIIYPAFIWGFAQLVTPEKSNGSLIKQNKIFIGSELLAQKMTSEKYFFERPSAVDYNTVASGGSNLGPTSADLKKIVQERSMALLKNHTGVIPQDLIFASASGLDPHISPAAAEFQIERVAKARSMNITTVRNLVIQLTEKPQFGILGESRVNVLKLNLALNEIKD